MSANEIRGARTNKPTMAPTKPESSGANCCVDIRIETQGSVNIYNCTSAPPRSEPCPPCPPGPITRHPWVIAVIGCDLEGRPTTESNLGKSIGRWGLAAPGENITSLGTSGNPQTSGGTSVAAPFVTGAIALLWSECPGASAARIKYAVTQAGRRPQRTIAPPVLDAWAAFEAMRIN